MGDATAPPKCKLCSHAHHLRDPHIFAGTKPEPEKPKGRKPMPQRKKKP